MQTCYFTSTAKREFVAEAGASCYFERGTLLLLACSCIAFSRSLHAQTAGLCFRISIVRLHWRLRHDTPVGRWLKQLAVDWLRATGYSCSPRMHLPNLRSEAASDSALSGNLIQVGDQGCDQFGPFYLCKEMSLWSTSTIGSCILKKPEPFCVSSPFYHSGLHGSIWHVAVTALLSPL